MIVHSPIYPQLKIDDLDIEFVDGVVEVGAKKKLEKLAAMVGYGFVFDEDPGDGDGTDDEDPGDGDEEVRND